MTYPKMKLSCTDASTEPVRADGPQGMEAFGTDGRADATGVVVRFRRGIGGGSCSGVSQLRRSIRMGIAYIAPIGYTRSSITDFR